MDKNITLEFPAKKLEALAHFLKKKDTSVEAEMGYALARLYEKTVPAHRPGIPGGLLGERHIRAKKFQRRDPL